MPETIGGYTILSEIGSGGFGTVYRAYNPRSDRAVALKILNSRAAANSNAIERFRREAELLHEIDDPNVMPLVDHGEDHDDYFIVMEMMQLSLRDVLASGRLTLSRSVDICRQAASGLKAIHDRDIVHRDIKPDNILFDSSGNVKVSDLGIARAEAMPNLTSTGIGIGTGRYMSPEQFMDSKRVDARSDIYSLGITLYEMLTGNPYDFDQSVKSVRGSIPDALQRIVKRCVELDRERRYQTMDELLREVDNRGLINRCALTDFYEATGGPNWKRNDNWLTDAPLSEWYGVFPEHLRNSPFERYPMSHSRESLMSNRMPVDYLGTYAPYRRGDDVNHLKLDGNNLKGEIPGAIGRLVDLSVLDLSDNPGIEGTFPPELWNLTLSQLYSIDLHNTRISGTLPTLDVGTLEYGIEMQEQEVNFFHLNELNLSNCQFIGDIPPSLRWHFDNLEHNRMYLAGNNWTGCIHRLLFYIPNNDLERIDLPICDW